MLNPGIIYNEKNLHKYVKILKYLMLFIELYNYFWTVFNGK